VIGAENDGDGEPGADGEKKKRQTRGGRGVVKVKQKHDVEKRICLSRACRGKRKFVTVITGLATYGELLSFCLLLLSKLVSKQVTKDQFILVQALWL